MGPNTRSYEYSVQISAFQSFRIQNCDLKTIFHCSSSTIHRAAETAVRENCTYLTDFSKHRPSGSMLSISRNVRLSVCLCVCSLLRYRLTVFLPPLPKSDVQYFKDSESLGKSNGKKWSQI